MRKLTLRLATDADCQTLAQLGERTFTETFLEGFGIAYSDHDLAVFIEASYSPHPFKAKIKDSAQAVWIFEQEGLALAYANSGPCRLPHSDARPGHGELYRLYVSKAAQGQGLGRRLLETTLVWLDGRYPGPVWLGVWSGNLKAQALYAAYGFEKVGEYQFPVGDSRDHEFILRRL
jgi:ribosomal protein S18 acetylase RimI-like enzyme